MVEQETPKLRIREWRKRKGLRQVDLAYRADVQPSTISHLENGNHVPNVRLLAAIAGALGVEITDLFPPPEPPKSPNPRSRPETIAREMAQMSPGDTGPMAAYADAWAGDGREGLERLERLRLVARDLAEEEGGNAATAGVAAWAAYWHRLFELSKKREATDEEVLKKLKENAA
jgi:transcriptional regulator with XRE-family HTH domain